jgi:2-oxoglutarate ferredoxin oxidoreductase subunit delta
LKRIIIDETYCKGCKLCIDQCPKEVFENSSKRNPKGYLIPNVAHAENCVACLLCEMICPDMAITVEDLDHEKGS